MVFGLIVAKVLLLGINVCTGALAAGLIYIGTRKVDYSDLGQTLYDGGAKGILVDPYILLLFVGSVLLYISVKGIFGACTGAKKVLLVYLAFILLWCCAMVYAAVLCFFFANKADEVVVKYWTEWKDALPEKYQDDDKLVAAEEHLKSAGALCAVTSVLLCVDIWCASRIMGHDYMFKRTTQVVNFVCFLLGGALIYLAVVAGKKGYGEEWAPAYIGCVGGVTVVLSAVGIAGISDEKRGLLKLHLGMLTIIFLFLMAGVVSSFVYADEARKIWRDLLVQFIEVEEGIAADLANAPPSPPGVDPFGLTNSTDGMVIPKGLAEAHLMGLGALGSILCVMILLNMAASWYFLHITEDGDGRRRKRRGGRRRRRRRRSSSEGSESEGSDSEDDRRSLRRKPSSSGRRGRGRGGSSEQKTYENEAYDDAGDRL